MSLSREQLTAMMGGKRHFNWSNGDLTPVKDEMLTVAPARATTAMKEFRAKWAALRHP